MNMCILYRLCFKQHGFLKTELIDLFHNIFPQRKTAQILLQIITTVFKRIQTWDMECALLAEIRLFR